MRQPAADYGGYPLRQPLSTQRSASSEWTLCRQPKKEREKRTDFENCLSVDTSLSLRELISMPNRIIVYQCPRCRTFIPTKSRAKKRFDSRCPRCNRRVQIWWPSRKRSVWDDSRGAERVVSYRAFHTMDEARMAAKHDNLMMMRHRHDSSIFKFERRDAGFIPASRLTQKELQRIKTELERQRKRENE